MSLPQEFINYVYRKRLEAVKGMVEGKLSSAEVYLEFTRTSPAVITDGPAGLSGSIKMIGFLPKEEFMDEVINEVRELIASKSKLGMREVMSRLVGVIYREELLDFSRFGGLEMGFKHSWSNIKATGKATLLFFTPPVTSYEVRCDVRIHEGGKIHEYLNLIHDVFHIVGGSRSSYPAYEFIIKEIYDQSATDEGFGRLIFRAG
ncbi:MAG: hypothetical protein J7L55_04940 [Desulfurococcales archaeon]|nr:hypothetical protein [Desulfurococcales archaeon]